MHPSSPTPSPTGSKPSDSPPSQPTQRELIESAISATVMEIIQLRRTLWLVLKQTGPLTVDEAQTHPLWRMKAIRQDDGKMLLEAVQLEEPSSHQMSILANLLDGTMTPLEAAMEKTDLKDYPPAYIHMMLQSRVLQRDDGYWVDATLHSIQQHPPTENN